MSEKSQNSIVLKEKNGERQLLDLGAIESKITAFTEAVPQLSHSKKMFGRTGSQYTSQLMSLTMLGDGPFHFMKQCMAQIEKKKNASLLSSILNKDLILQKLRLNNLSYICLNNLYRNHQLLY